MEDAPSISGLSPHGKAKSITVENWRKKCYQMLVSLIDVIFIDDHSDFRRYPDLTIWTIIIETQKENLHFYMRKKI
jgi:hypothetical protein